MYLELGAIPELQDMGHGHHREYTAEQIQKIHTIWQLNQMGFTKPKAIHWADQIKALKEEVGNL